MSKVGSWSTTAGSNNATPPDGWPEGQAPSTVNDCAREMMAQIRTLISDAQYIDQNITPTFISATSFSVTGDQTSAIHAGRRLKLFDGSTFYATVLSASFTAVTTISVSSTGALTASLSSFAIAILSRTNDSIPRGLPFEGDSISLSGAATVGTTLTVSGATTLKSTLSVGGATIITGALRADSTLTVSAAATLKGALSVGTTLIVGGAARLDDNLTVSGATALLGALSVGGAAVFGTTMTVSGATALLGALSVGGAATFGTTLTASGAVTLKTTLSVGGASIITGAARFDSTMTVSAATVMKGALSVGGGLIVAGTGSFLDTLSVSGTVVAANVAKAWVRFIADGAPAADSGFNIASISRSALGVFRINFTTPFADGSYAFIVSLTSSRFYQSESAGTGASFKFSIVDISGSAAETILVNAAFYR